MRHRNLAGPVATGLLALLPFQTVDTAQATAVLEIVTAFASSYTRGQGFTDGVPNSDVGSAARSGDSFGHAAWLAGVVMIASNSIGVNRPRPAWRRRRW